MRYISQADYEDALEVIRLHEVYANCKHERTEHIVDLNSFPYGEDFRYDKCLDCGKMLHLENLREK